mmetsp:Transcript_68510/g.164529  ORF Transcript_68510/g.164529 Transcript_68510/m.164529 type:complete len:689 (-) Transcript_68510:37-2103(-)|eukprot:CAMPEP_0178405644 /NCGR_PEP_ID=MMETSP0689_2-20121128/18506_1 /TAXON_ID=160604 /ORGANISM="Amphidinium massartii, Strain CS-259" /LENGTH=688 /DNA_ID=CAMNT_0020026667 /DNA_START=27 /DNA_END=2093 /DNA_ORIENTATION=-
MGAACANGALQCLDTNTIHKDQAISSDQQAAVDETTDLVLGWAAGRRKQCGETLVMKRYKMFMGDEDVVGEGTYSICRRGIDTKTGSEVAIKVYKQKKKEDSNAGSIKLVKFRRQVAVLQQLQEPFTASPDQSLWTPELAETKPRKVFMWLVDYSRDQFGQPGPDKDDGVMYVITELAQYSLKDFLADCKHKHKKLSKETVRSITKALLLVTAGLHAKGLVHLDLKPENFMVFNGDLKLIDVDGCVQYNSQISINDSSLCFSPCYCAPEWARFLIDDVEDRQIPASPMLDVWSVGVTIAELVTQEAILEPTYSSFVRHGRSQQEAGYLFMEWLSGVKKAPLPKSVAAFDKDLADLLRVCLMHTDVINRKSCAQALGHRFCTTMDRRNRRNSNPLDDRANGDAEGPLMVPVRSRRRREEDTSADVQFKGTLWKLNAGGDAKNAAHWLLRDMWVATNSSLCYYSQKEEKRLVLIDGSDLSKATISAFEGGARKFAFQIAVHNDDEQEATKAVFACDSAEDYKRWVSTLESVHINVQLHTMQLGKNMASQMRTLKLNVKNRRMRVQSNNMNYEPIFSGKLWKVKTDGSALQEEDWFERDMWVSRNGSLVYLSKKEEKELVYYTPADLSRASLKKVPAGSSCKPHAFQIILAPASGIEFAPGEFAAESEEMLAKWMEALKEATRESSKENQV